MDEWEQYSKAPTQNTASTGSEDWDQYATGNVTGAPEAFGSGALQGLSFGFADEALGTVQGALDPNKTIKESIESNRARRKILEQEHPIASVAGDITGSIAPTALSIAGTVASGGVAAPAAIATGAKTGASIGLLGAKLAAKFGAKKAIEAGAGSAIKKGLGEAIGVAAKEAPVLAEKAGLDVAKNVIKKAPSKGLEAALTGAAAGVGYSDAIASDDPEAAMRGVVSAGLGGALGYGAHKILPLVGRGAKFLMGGGGRKAASGLLEVPEEAIKFAANPAQRAMMNTTKTMPIIGEEALEHVSNRIGNNRAASGESFKILEKSIEKESPYKLENVFDKNIDEVAKGNIGGTYDASIKSLEDMKSRVMEKYKLTDKSAKAVPLEDVKHLIWEVEDRIPDNYINLSQAEKIAAKPFVKIRKELNQLLREKSIEYADKMDVIAKETEYLKNFRKSYHDNPETLGRAISDYMKAERKGVQLTKKQGIIDELAKENPEFIEEAKAVWARDEFMKERGKGSTNSIVGMAIGGSVIGTTLMAAGVPAPIAMAIGGAIGAGFGKIYNKYGSQMTRAMLQKWFENAEKKQASNVPHIMKEPLKEFTNAMLAIPDEFQRFAVVNALLQKLSMDQSAQQNQTISPAGIKYAFDRIAR